MEIIPTLYVMYKCQNICMKNQGIYLLKSWTSKILVIYKNIFIFNCILPVVGAQSKKVFRLIDSDCIFYTL